MACSCARGWALLGTAREMGSAPLPALRAGELPREASRHVGWLSKRSQVRNQIPSLVLAWNSWKRHEVAR
jgi:hypothetical protein